MALNFKDAHLANFKYGRGCPIQYIVIHYTANDGDTASGNANYFNRTITQTSAHYFVDESKDIWQTVRDEDTAWHCGTTGTYKHPICRNNNSIGIELCSRKDSSGKYYFKDETVANAVVLTKEIMEKYRISPANVLRHYDVTGKICPAPFIEDEEMWSDFLDRLAPAQEPEQEEASTVRFDLFGGKTIPVRGANNNGTVYVAARELLEIMGFVVGWDDSTKTVLIRSKTIIATTAEEWLILEKIIEAEASGEDEVGKILVANVILNRVNSKEFPNNIKEVVFQPQQFEPTRNGAYERAVPSEITLDAVQKALNGVDYSQNATFFRTIVGATPDCWHEKELTRLFDYGRHRFYK